MNVRAPSTIDDLGAALRLLRLQRSQQLTVREISHRVGCRESEVVDWEEGRAVPTPRQFARLRNMVDRSIGAFKPLVDGYWRARRESELAAADAEVAPDLAPSEPALNTMRDALAVAMVAPSADPPAAASEPEREWPAGDPRAAETFGEALRRAREAEGISVLDLARLLGVTGSQVRRWQAGTFMPVASLRQQMLDLFPVLLDAPSTNHGVMSRPGMKPPGRRKVELHGIAAEAAAKAAEARAARRRTRVTPAGIAAGVAAAGERYAAALAKVAELELAARAAQDGIAAAHAGAAKLRQDAETAAAQMVAAAEEKIRVAAEAAAAARAEAKRLQEELATAATAAARGEGA